MIYREHLIEIWVNGKKLELESQKSLNLRFNNVLFDPTKISSTQAEYSFEFELPCTPANNKIFDYANNLSKLNKFRTRFDAEVYADGSPIFRGSLTLSSVKDKKYKVNLVSIKTYSLEDIFGDSVLTDIPWSIPFDGAGSNGSTIDNYNSEVYNRNRDDVCFPLISYGVFQKSPISKDEVGSEYSSKFDLDKYNRWYIESFYPSLSMLETMKKAFEYKGYNVGGDAFKNIFLKDVFMSCNLADGQSPNYNLGNPKFGKVDLNVSWSTPMNGSAYTQSLNFPYFRIGGQRVGGKTQGSSWNFDEVQLYDMLSEGTVNVSSSSYLYQPNEHVIVIPADGFYKITLSGTANLTQNSSFQANQLYIAYDDDFYNAVMGEVEIPVNGRKFMPFEIQLVRNYDDDIELIKGENNFLLTDGVPLHETVYGGETNIPNYNSFYSAFPHEKAGSCYYGGGNGKLYDWRWEPPTDITRFGEETNKSLYNFEADTNMGYLFNDGDIMAYDPCVNPNFILGFTSMGNDNGGGCASVIKNGYSWSKTVSERYDSLYNQQGYWRANTTFDEYGYPTWNMSTTLSTHNQNIYNGSFSYFSSNQNAINGKIECLVHLNRNDVLQLYAVQRNYTHDGDQVQYQVSANYNLSIEAVSPKAYEYVKTYSVNAPTDFDYDLRLSNFLNNETKISDWIQSIVDAFNLEVIQNGTNVEINTKKQFMQNMPYAVDIDDRVNSSEAESSIIDYPKSMAVKYKIDTDEWGFERSAVENASGDESVLNDDDWKKYGDSGYTEIVLNDDSYVTNKSEKSLQFSYTWYENFNWYTVNSSGEQINVPSVRLRIPCISKFSYMIDGYDYEESMKHDGYGFAQRFWFRPQPTECYVWTETYPKEQVTIYKTSNQWSNGNLYCNLSYKSTEPSLLTNFFNISAYLASNYVEVDAYLTPDEYNSIKNGALVHFDSDLYIPVEINGYDPSGYNPTTLKLMKKVV